MANEIMTKFYKDINSFISKSGKYMDKLSKKTEEKPDDPDDYMPFKHMVIIEEMLTRDPTLSGQLINLYHKIRPMKDEERKKGLIKSYSSILSENYQ